MNKRAEISDIVKRLHDLARNLWWSWDPNARALFEELSPLIWESSNHNPVAVLNQFSETEMRARLGDREFLKRTLVILESFDNYMQRTSRTARAARTKSISPVAYFCAEFGVHECLPFYSGGLGVLAGII